MANQGKSFEVSLDIKQPFNSSDNITASLESIARGAATLATAIAATAIAISAYVVKAASSLDSLYFASNRVGSSVNNIEALKYAMTQAGGVASDGLVALEAFASTLRKSPAQISLLERFGIKTKQDNGKLRDSSELVIEFAGALKGLPQVVQNQYIEAFGIDGKTFLVLQNNVRPFFNEYNEKLQKAGINSQELAKKGHDFSESLRTLMMTIQVLGQKVSDNLLGSSKTLVIKFKELVDANIDEIAKTVAEFAKALWSVFKGIMALIGGLAAVIVFITSFFENLKSFIQIFTGEKGWIAGFRDFANLLSSKLLPVLEKAMNALGVSTTQEESKQEKQGWGDWVKSKLKSIGHSIGIGTASVDISKSNLSGSGNFKDKAPSIMQTLMNEFGITQQQAAIIMGNLGHESGGLSKMQEVNPQSGRGGYGWAQWTASRRVAFEKFAATKGLELNSDAANLQFLVHELKTTHSSAITALKAAKDDTGLAMSRFEELFEGAGIKNYGSRFRYAAQAYKAYADSQNSARLLTVPKINTQSFASISRVGLNSQQFVSGNTSLNHSSVVNIHGVSDPVQAANLVAGHQKQVADFGAGQIKSSMSKQEAQQ